MRKAIGEITVAAIIAFCLVIIIAFTGCHTTTRSFGGEMTVELEPGQKLEEVTWKDTDLWFLTRPFRDGEEPETHIFQEDSEWGVWEGTVTIIESK